jgi:outer membrane biosynthesis protein TonB
VRVVRWAGFGLDEEVVSTVRRMHFRPAAREGGPVAVRVLLRYNFRKPPKA